MPTNELSMAKTMNHCSGASSFEVGIKNVKSVSNHLPLPKWNHSGSFTLDQDSFASSVQDSMAYR